MKEKLQGILQTAKEQLAAAKDSRALDEARVKFLGKKGELTALLKGMKDVAARGASGCWSADQRRSCGDRNHH